MAEVQQFDEVRQRDALLALANSSDFLHTPEGLATVAELRTVFMPIIAAAARNVGLGSHWIAADEVVNTAIVELSADRGRVAKMAAESSMTPWAYLNRCLLGWMRAQWGSRCQPLDVVEEMVERGQAEVIDLTPLDVVVRLTYGQIAPYTDQGLHAELLALLTWLAQNPPQRLSYEAADRAAAKWRFSRLTSEQISAVMNISWGGRPRRHETSLMGAFLLDPTFRPLESPTHARAMLRYKKLMRLSTAEHIEPQNLAA